MVFNWLQAVATIDGEIGPQLSVRRKREGAGVTFFDANMYPQGSMGVVPEALRPKPGHLSLSQQRVYEVIYYLLLGKCSPWKNAMLFFFSFLHLLLSCRILFGFPGKTNLSKVRMFCQLLLQLHLVMLVSLARMVQHLDN